ncbi:MAG: sigma-70 family RNA polymerase sigma factor [Verrucomicrobiota bacterium]
MNPPSPAPFSPAPGDGPAWELAADAALALAAAVPDRAGKEAFVEIVRRHQTAVGAVAWSVTGRIGLVDDIAQETFFKAWKRMATLREPAKLRAWLTRIAHDCAVDAIQGEKSHLPLHEPAPGLPAVCGSPAPDRAAAEAEEEALVWSSLAALPETLRTPLVLYYREGQSVAAVAEALDLSEDAVKQRLSRGRQALRAAVETRIETVLGRIQPSALLIATIAAGIGLLSKPAAIAAGATSGVITIGSAGSAGSAGGATAAAGSAATTTAAGSAAGAAGISTFMTATTWLAAAITLAAFLPVGWKTGGPDGTGGGRSAASALSGSPAAPTDPFAAFPNSRLLAEWRRLHLVHGSDAAAMPSLYTAIQSENDGFHRDSLTLALMAEWAAVDPESAFRLLWSEKKKQNHAALMLREWLKRAPDQASAHLAANLSGAESLAAVLMPDIASFAPDHFMALFSSLPDPKQGKYAPPGLPPQIAEAFEIFARSHPETAGEALPLLKGEILVNSQVTIATLMAAKDPAAAMDWAAALDPKTGQERAVKAVGRAWALTDPAAAIRHLPPGFDPDEAARILGVAGGNDLPGALRLWRESAEQFTPLARPAMGQAVAESLQKDPLATIRLLSGESPEVQEKMFPSHSLLNGRLYGDLSAGQKQSVWDWVVQQKPEGMAGNISDGLLTAEFHNDPAAAARRLASLPEEWQTRLCTASDDRGGITGTLNLAECEQLLRTVAPAARPQLLAAFFGKTDDGAVPDLQLWRSRVDGLPPESRENAVSSFTGGLARTDPRQALEFAESLPQGNLRQAAFSRLVGQWSTGDAHAASAWVATLPPGGERDAAAAGLVKSLPIGDTDAALTWAATIADPRLRLQSLQNFLKTAGWTDPDKIPALLENPLISPADREALRQAPAQK